MSYATAIQSDTFSHLLTPFHYHHIQNIFHYILHSDLNKFVMRETLYAWWERGQCPGQARDSLNAGELTAPVG